MKSSSERVLPLDVHNLILFLQNIHDKDN